MEVQWYPGQMAKAKRLLKDNLKYVDAVIEVLDARIPAASRNPDIRGLLAKRPVAAVLARADLAQPEVTRRWLSELSRDYFTSAAVNANTGEGVNKLVRQLQTLPRRAGENPRRRLVVVGIPNVGKSSLINRLTGRSAAETGDKPGVTKDKQWIRVQGDLELLDTPGMLWPKIASRWQAFALAAAGAVKDDILDPLALGMIFLRYLQREAPDRLISRYSLEAMPGDPRQLLTAIALRRGTLLKGGTVNLEAAARLLIKDFREGRLGRITLEKPGEQRTDDDEIFRNDCGDDFPVSD